jgi:hypothetical protein
MVRVCYDCYIAEGTPLPPSQEAVETEAPAVVSLRRCSRCRDARYCSGAHQQAHWQSSHRHSCKAIPAVDLEKAANAPASKCVDMLQLQLRRLGGEHKITLVAPILKRLVVLCKEGNLDRYEEVLANLLCGLQIYGVSSDTAVMLYRLFWGAPGVTDFFMNDLEHVPVLSAFVLVMLVKTAILEASSFLASEKEPLSRWRVKSEKTSLCDVAKDRAVELFFHEDCDVEAVMYASGMMALLSDEDEILFERGLLKIVLQAVFLVRNKQVRKKYQEQIEMLLNKATAFNWSNVKDIGQVSDLVVLLLSLILTSEEIIKKPKWETTEGDESTETRKLNNLGVAAIQCLGALVREAPFDYHELLSFVLENYTDGGLCNPLGTSGAAVRLDSKVLHLCGFFNEHLKGEEVSEESFKNLFHAWTPPAPQAATKGADEQEAEQEPEELVNGEVVV